MTTDTNLLADREIANRLPRVWGPFFGRFGRLTETQRSSIPPILSGANVLVCAPTAAGKTEAACAPLVERNLGTMGSWTILYVSPTRALVNDLYERLTGPLSQLGLRVARRTGDHRDTLGKPPHVLVTTPESFDSLLCRGRLSPEGHVLANVVAVVLDEIHLLHPGPRGEQIRWLLERLRRLRKFAAKSAWCKLDSFQVIALSATVPDPADVARSYLSGGQVIQVGGSREIEAATVECKDPSVECALPAYIRRLDRPEKILVFSNARKRVDLLALGLRPALEALGYEVRAHHGSLAQCERERAEAAIKTARKIVVFATATLEIGIDIGDIDLVVLDGPAPDVGALLQRIGRGNRRTGKTRVMLCAGSLAEVLVQSAMLDAARASYLGPLERGPWYSVAHQQLASFIFQSNSRSRRPETLKDLLSACVPELSAADMLSHLVSCGHLEEDEAGVRLGAEWRDATERGEIHSNIESQPGHTVVDQRTGEQIAKGVRACDAKGLGVGGQLLDVKEWTERYIEVHRVDKLNKPLGNWSYNTNRWIEGAGQPQAIRRYLRFPQDVWPVLIQGNGVRVFHFGGARRMALLQVLSSRAVDGSVARVDKWTLSLPSSHGSKPIWVSDAGPALIDVLLPEWLEKLESCLGVPRSNQRLPRDVRLAEVRAWLGVARQMDEICESRWVVEEEETVVAALQMLSSELRQKHR